MVMVILLLSLRHLVHLHGLLHGQVCWRLLRGHVVVLVILLMLLRRATSSSLDQVLQVGCLRLETAAAETMLLLVHDGGRVESDRSSIASIARRRLGSYVRTE